MKLVLKIVLPIVIVAAALAAFMVMVMNRPPAPKIEPLRSVQAVEVQTVRREPAKVTLPSQGIVEAERVTLVAAEVGGRVIRVSEKFNAGEPFEADEVMVEIDPADFEAAVTQAKAGLAEAKLALETEKARAEQVVKDWEKLAARENPTEFALRKPHVESAAAQVKAAESALTKANHDLERTRIRAPFRGRIRSTHTELGSVLAPGARVAEMFSTGRYEVRLPLSLDDFAFARPLGGDDPVPVRLTATFGGREVHWDAVADRYEGEVERSSRTVVLVARLEEQAGDPLLQPGLFVRAQIDGQTLGGVVRVPRRAFLDENRLLVVDGKDQIRARTVKPLRGDGIDLLIEEGLIDGERVCLTALAAPVDGMSVKIVESTAKDKPQQPANPPPAPVVP